MEVTAEKQACIVAGLLFDSGSVQIRRQMVRGGAPIRVAVAGLMLGLWLVLIALGCSPELHRLLHADSSQPSHDCVVTQLTKSQFLTAGSAISVIVAASSFFGFPPLTERIALCADVRLAPPRGPPAASFLL